MGSVDEAVRKADIVMVLVPDEKIADLYGSEIGPNLKKGGYLAFAHGFNIHFGQVVPRSDVGVFMVAPKSPGHLVRHEYTKGNGVPMLLAVHQDPSGTRGRWGWRTRRRSAAGGPESSRRPSARRRRPTSSASRWSSGGGTTALITAAFETLVEAGYAPEMAYFECLHELKLIVDLIYEGGISNMRYSISNTAQYGDLTRGPRIVTEQTKAEMKKILGEIQSGAFAREWMLENKVNRPVFNALTRRGEEHPIEGVGSRLRAMMPWLAHGRLVDKTKN